MPPKHTFRAVIEDAGSGGASVTIPFDIEHTRQSRIAKAAEMLKQGKREHA